MPACQLQLRKREGERLACRLGGRSTEEEEERPAWEERKGRSHHRAPVLTYRQEEDDSE
jgi:hypothetical protein